VRSAQLGPNRTAHHRGAACTGPALPFGPSLSVFFATIPPWNDPPPGGTGGHLNRTTTKPASAAKTAVSRAHCQRIVHFFVLGEGTAGVTATEEKYLRDPGTGAVFFYMVMVRKHRPDYHGDRRIVLNCVWPWPFQSLPKTPVVNNVHNKAGTVEHERVHRLFWNHNPGRFAFWRFRSRFAIGGDPCQVKNVGSSRSSRSPIIAPIIPPISRGLLCFG
jgi:hypothetical protein